MAQAKALHPAETVCAPVPAHAGSTLEYPLPAAQPAGYTLHVVDGGENFLVEARYRGAAGAPAPGPGRPSRPLP